jgi:hypothetical protein
MRLENIGILAGMGATGREDAFSRLPSAPGIVKDDRERVAISRAIRSAAWLTKVETDLLPGKHGHLVPLAKP